MRYRHPAKHGWAQHIATQASLDRVSDRRQSWRRYHRGRRRLGDGVNIASRLEGIADPGQVYISGGIYEQIKHKLVCGYELLGDRKVKNITDPVRVYRVLPDPAAFNRTRKRRENILIFLLSLTLLAIAGGALWYLLLATAGKVGYQTQATVSPEMPNAPPSPPPAKPAAPSTSALASGSMPRRPNTQPVPSAAPTVKQTVTQPQLASPAAPATQPRRSREPEMNTVRGGSFTMGSNDDVTEKPTHQVTIKPFAISQYPISVRDWNDCAAAKACAFVATGKDDAPITNVSWSDAKQFVCLARGRNAKAISAAKRSRMGICRARRHANKVLVGRSVSIGHGQLQELRDIARHRATDQGRQLQAKSVWSVRYGWRRRSVGRGLLA